MKRFAKMQPFSFAKISFESEEEPQDIATALLGCTGNSVSSTESDDLPEKRISLLYSKTSGSNEGENALEQPYRAKLTNSTRDH